MYTKLNPVSWRGNSAVDYGVEAVDVCAGGGAGVDVVQRATVVMLRGVGVVLRWTFTDFQTRRLGPLNRYHIRNCSRTILTTIYAITEI